MRMPPEWWNQGSNPLPAKSKKLHAQSVVPQYDNSIDNRGINPELECRLHIANFKIMLQYRGNYEEHSQNRDLLTNHNLTIGFDGSAEEALQDAPSDFWEHLYKHHIVPFQIRGTLDPEKYASKHCICAWCRHADYSLRSDPIPAPLIFALHELDSNVITLRIVDDTTNRMVVFWKQRTNEGIIHYFTCLNMDCNLIDPDTADWLVSRAGFLAHLETLSSKEIHSYLLDFDIPTSFAEDILDHLQDRKVE